MTVISRMDEPSAAAVRATNNFSDVMYPDHDGADARAAYRNAPMSPIASNPKRPAKRAANSEFMRHLPATPRRWPPIVDAMNKMPFMRVMFLVMLMVPMMRQCGLGDDKR